MIEKEIFYAVKCDRCGEMNDCGDYQYYLDEGSAIEQAYESEWNELKGKHYCPDCHTVDEETDEVKPYEEYPQHLKTLNGFIDKILRGGRGRVEERNNEFVVKSNFYKKSRLELYEVDYIKNLLGDKFISIDYEAGKWGNFCCIIIFKK